MFKLKDFIPSAIALLVLAGIMVSPWIVSAQTILPTGEYVMTKYTTVERPFDTIFQNLTGKGMIVSVSATDTAGARTYDCYVDSANPPVEKVGRFDTPFANAYSNCTFVVPNGYFYKVKNETGAGSVLFRWIEWTQSTTTINATTTTTTVVNQVNEIANLFYGMILFMIAFWGVIWFFRKNR